MDGHQSTSARLTNLRPHPFQAVFFGDINAADDRLLATDLRQRGQLAPIVVMPESNVAGLPAGTILDGHRRARLMLANGATEAAVTVRHDLKDADAATVEAEFLRYNFLRRQLHPIDKARVALRLLEIRKKRAPGKLSTSARGEAREVVGEAMGMSGRNLDRYLRLLQTPLCIQNAVRDGRLKLVTGAKIALLDRGVQNQIADAIASVAKPSEVARVVEGFIHCADGRRHVKAADAVATLARHLDSGLSDLGDRVEQVSENQVRRHLSTLQRGLALLADLIRKTEAVSNSP